MAGYDVLAVDMDGTILNSEKKILAETLSDIEAADAAGKVVALCTGRGPSEIADYKNELEKVRFRVLISGAYVVDAFENRVIYHTGVRPRETYRLLDLAEKYGGMPHFLTADESIIPVREFEYFEEYGMGIYRPLFERNARKIQDMRSEVPGYEFFEKVNIYFKSSALRDQARAELEAEGVPLSLSNAEEQSLESSPPDAGKGLGILRLSEYMDIPPERIAAVGDMDNDRPMFQVVGLPIAMGNAPEDVKKLCRVVVSDNDHNGVGEAIRRYLLQGEI